MSSHIGLDLLKKGFNKVKMRNDNIFEDLLTEQPTFLPAPTEVVNPRLRSAID